MEGAKPGLPGCLHPQIGNLYGLSKKGICYMYSESVQDCIVVWTAWKARLGGISEWHEAVYQKHFTEISTQGLIYYCDENIFFCYTIQIDLTR